MLMTICLRLLKNMLHKDVPGTFSGLGDYFYREIWRLSDKYQPVLHMIQFFGRYLDDNLFKTVEKYVAGRLLMMSLEFFQGLCHYLYCEIWRLRDK